MNNPYDALRQKNTELIKGLNLPNFKPPPFKILLWEDRYPRDIAGLVQFTPVNCTLPRKIDAHGAYVAQVMQTIYPGDFSFYAAIGWGEKFKNVIDFCIANNIRLINASIAIPEDAATEEQLKRYAEWGGIIVAAAGNDGGHPVKYPARSPYTICVSTISDPDCDGSEIDITVNSGWFIRMANGQYDKFHDTSSASPVGSTCAAYILAVHPGWRLEDVRKFLRDNSTPGPEKWERVFRFPDGFGEWKQVEMDVPMQIINGRTMVPARFIAEAFGGLASWDEKSQTATFVAGNRTVKAVVGSKTLLVKEG